MAGRKIPADPQRQPQGARQTGPPHHPGVRFPSTQQPSAPGFDAQAAAARPDPAIDAAHQRFLQQVSSSFAAADFLSTYINAAVGAASHTPGVDVLKVDALGRHFMDVVRTQCPTLHLGPRWQAPPSPPTSPTPTSPPYPAPLSPHGELRDSRRAAAPGQQPGAAKPAAQRPQPTPKPLETPFQPVVSKRQRTVGTPKQQVASPPARGDNRVLLQFPLETQEVLQKPGSLAVIRKQILTAGQMDDGEIAAIRQTKTGVAVTLKTDAARQRIFQAADAIRDATGATTLQSIKAWHVYVIHNVPTVIDQESVDEVAVRREAETQAGQTVTMARQGRPNHHLPDVCTWTVAFEGKVAYRFRLFETSTSARAQKQQQKVNQCSICWDFHLTHHCQRPQRCRNCGRIGAHEECELKCRNCQGPHEADLPTCPARPKRVNGVITPPSKAKLGRIRARHAADRLRDKSQTPEPEPVEQSTPEQEPPRPDTASVRDIGEEEFQGFPLSQNQPEPENVADPQGDVQGQLQLLQPQPQPQELIPSRSRSPLAKRKEYPDTSLRRTRSTKEKSAKQADDASTIVVAPSSPARSQEQAADDALATTETNTQGVPQTNITPTVNGSIT